MIWPSITEERAAALHARRVPVPMAWRHNGLILRIVFFCLTCSGAFALAGFARLLDVPAAEAVSGTILLLVAEWLIWKKRFFWTGIELSLWVSAAVLFVLALPSSGKPEAFLVIGAALGIAGFRMRSAFIGVLAIACIVIYAGVKANDGLAPLAVTIAITLAAAVALTREWQRPSTEQLFQAAAIVIPPVGAVAALVVGRALSVYAPFALLAVALFILGIHNRDRVLLIAATITFTIAAADASYRFLHFAYEWKLIDAGLLTLAIAIAVSRALRGRVRGFVVSPEAAKSYDEANATPRRHARRPARRPRTSRRWIPLRRRQLRRRRRVSGILRSELTADS
jgi:hypothetical protein